MEGLSFGLTESSRLVAYTSSPGVLEIVFDLKRNFSPTLLPLTLRLSEEANLEFGTVQLYTGNGKGKTTAAFGAALRAIGHGLKVYLVQFMKGDPNYGELKACQNLPNITIVQSGLETFVDRENPSPEDIRLAKRGLKLAREALLSSEYDLVIMDEVNVAVDYGLLDVEEVLELVRQKPKAVELILTGRYAHPRLIEAADTVSEVKEVKHHYQKGIKGREGIEH